MVITAKMATSNPRSQETRAGLLVRTLQPRPTNRPLSSRRDSSRRDEHGLQR